MAQKEWRTWCDDHGLIHAIELVHGGQPVLYCGNKVYRFAARVALDLEEFDTIEEPLTCLLCAAWWP